MLAMRGVFRTCRMSRWSFYSLTIFVKRSLFNVWQGSEYTSEWYKTKQPYNLHKLLFFWQYKCNIKIDLNSTRIITSFKMVYHLITNNEWHIKIIMNKKRDLWITFNRFPIDLLNNLWLYYFIKCLYCQFTNRWFSFSMILEKKSSLVNYSKSKNQVIHRSCFFKMLRNTS